MLKQSIKQLCNRWEAWCSESVNRSILGAALILAAATLLVKIITVIKDVIVASNFGVGDSLDIFLMAYLLPMFAISVFAGSFHSAFIPVLVNVREQHGHAEGKRLFLNIALLAFVMLIVVMIVFAIVDEWFIHFIASGFDVAKLNQTVILFDQMLPVIVVGGMALFGGAVLNTHNKFATPALAPIFTPLLIVLGIYLKGNVNDPEILAVGTIVGTVFELLVVARGLHKLDYLQWPQELVWDAHSSKVVDQYLPMIGGAFLMSGTVLIDQVMTSWLPSGSISALSYANKIPGFISGLAAAAIGTVVLPYLSKQVNEHSYSAMKHTFFTYSKIILAISIPVVLLGTVFSNQIIEIMYERKAFGTSDTLMVSEIMRYSLLQVPFYVLGTMFARFVSVLTGNKVLLYVAIVNLALNVILNLILMRTMGVAGVALSTSIVYIISTAILGLVAVRKINNRIIMQ